jgi:hypothetical protein
MSGSRKAAPRPVNPLLKVAGPALGAALALTILVLLVFGDRIMGGGPGDEGAEERARTGTEIAATSVDPATQDEVVTAASAVLNRWSQPDARYDKWWRNLRPLLTPGGREAYAYTDPAQVPELADMRPDHVVLNPSGATATVWFETSDGVFGVDLSRKDATGPWLANRVVFPGQESMFA